MALQVIKMGSDYSQMGAPTLTLSNAKERHGRAGREEELGSSVKESPLFSNKEPCGLTA